MKNEDERGAHSIPSVSGRLKLYPDLSNIEKDLSLDTGVEQENKMTRNNDESFVGNLYLENEQTGINSRPKCTECETCKSNCCQKGSACISPRENVGVDGTLNFEANEHECRREKNTKCCIFRKSFSLMFSGFCMLGVTGLSIADIVTDILTARNYYLTEKHTAFILSLVFLILPPILLTAGILKRRDDQTRHSKNSAGNCCIKFLIVIANVPLKLYMLWLQILYAVKCFRRFHKWRVSKCQEGEKTLLHGSLQHFVSELSLYKLWNSIFESMPQLILTIHVIMTTPNIHTSNEGYLLIISSIFSFGSLCLGIIYYSVKLKESETHPVDKNSAIHPVRSKSTVLGLPQIIFLSVFTVCFLSSRVISFSYFVLFFSWYSAIVPGLHCLIFFVFFTYRRYLNKNNKMHRYRLKAYKRQSSSFVYVLVHSLMSVFIHIKPESGELLDQPRYFKLFYYFIYIIENSVMILSPVVLKYFLPHITNERLEELQYFPLTYTTLACMGFGALTCAMYHICVHKAAPFTREAVFAPCCKCCYGPGGFLCWSCSCCCRPSDDEKVYVMCKNIHNHEVRSISLKDIRAWKASTESKLLNEKILRKWKVVQNSINEQKEISRRNQGSVEGRTAKQTRQGEPEGGEQNESGDCPYTMRRTGLHILSDPFGNLFYAPINEIKLKTSARNSERGI